MVTIWGVELPPKFLNVAIIGPPFIKMPLYGSKHVINVKDKVGFREYIKYPLGPTLKSNLLMYEGLILWALLWASLVTNMYWWRWIMSPNGYMSWPSQTTRVEISFSSWRNTFLPGLQSHVSLFFMEAHTFTTRCFGLSLTNMGLSIKFYPIPPLKKWSNRSDQLGNQSYTWKDYQCRFNKLGKTTWRGILYI